MKFDLSKLYEIANSMDAESDGTFESALGANIKPVLTGNEVNELSDYINRDPNNEDLVPYLTRIKDKLASGKKDMETNTSIQRDINGATRYGKAPDDVTETLRRIEDVESYEMGGHIDNSTKFKQSPQSKYNSRILVTDKMPDVDRSAVKMSSNQDMDDFNDEFPMDNYMPIEDGEKEEISDAERNAMAFLQND